MPARPDLLANVLRRIADLDWALYGEERVPGAAQVGNLNAWLVDTRRALSASGVVMPYLFTRYLVETRPDIFELRVSVARSLPRPISPENAADAANAVAPALRDLFRRRNAAARQLGSPHYAALLLGSLNLGFTELAHWLAGLLPFLGPPVVPGTPWLQYHHSLREASAQAGAQVRLSEDALREWAYLLELNGTRLWSDVQSPARVHGWCLARKRPEEVRLLFGVQAEIALGPLLHELGHYLHYTAPTPEEWALRLPPPVFDECLACLLGMTAFRPTLQVRVAPLITRPASPEMPRLHAAVQRQWAVSALFELQAYEADGEGLDARWQRIVSQAGFAPSSPQEWALDPFYVDDPVHRFSDVLGTLWSVIEVRRLAPASLAEVAGRIRELAQAGYEVHWREALGLANDLPNPRPYLDLWQG
jgi:hypothetical protein